MARYRMDDGTVVDTANATESWQEQSDFDGRNYIGRSSRSQWHDQTLHRSRKGRYYIEYESRVSGERDHADWITKAAATAWLIMNEKELPEDLKEFEAAVTE